MDWDWEEAAGRAATELRRTREERGISQRQLADEAGVNPALVSRVERGRDARISTWARLFFALGYELRFDLNELAEEMPDLLLEERDRREERVIEGLCTGKRRFFR